MHWKLDPVILKYVNVLKYLNDSIEYVDETQTFISNSAIVGLNINPRAVDFLLENSIYLSVIIFKNPAFVPYIKDAWNNLNTIYDGAFIRSFDSGAIASHLFGSVDEWALKEMLLNPELDLKKIMKITGYTEPEIKKKMNSSFELTCLANYNGIFQEKIKALKTKTEQEDFYNALQLDYWFASNPKYLDVSVDMHNVFCDPSDIIELPLEKHLDTPPSELNPKLLNIIKNTKTDSKFLGDYFAKYMKVNVDAGTCIVPKISKVHNMGFLPYSINIMNHPDLLKLAEKVVLHGRVIIRSNSLFINWIINSVGFLDFFKLHLDFKWTVGHWFLIIKHRKSGDFFREIVDVYSKHFGYNGMEETIEKTPELKKAFNSFEKYNLDNSLLFVEDYKKNAIKNGVFFKELMENRWSPMQVEKWLDAGIDPDDF